MNREEEGEAACFRIRRKETEEMNLNVSTEVGYLGIHSLLANLKIGSLLRGKYLKI